MDCVRKVKRSAVSKIEIRPENVKKILNTNFFETYELMRDYHIA